MRIIDNRKIYYSKVVNLAPNLALTNAKAKKIIKKISKILPCSNAANIFITLDRKNITGDQIFNTFVFCRKNIFTMIRYMVAMRKTMIEGNFKNDA